MRTRPWIEIMAVTLFLALAASLISWSGSRTVSADHVGLEQGTEERSETVVDCEVRFAEQVELLRIEQNVGGIWELVFEQIEPGAMIFELLNLQGEGPLKFTVIWPSEVGESAAEIKLGLSGQTPVSHTLWGEGEHQELIELPEFEVGEANE